MEDKKEKAIDLETIIEEVANRRDLGLNEEETKQQIEVLKKIYIDGMLPQKALDITDEYMATAYKCAYNFYQQSKFQEAQIIFEWLNQMNPLEPKYRKGSLHCFIQLKKWQEAINILLFMAYLEPKDPHPYAKMAECLIELDDYAEALIATEQAIKIAGDQAQFADDKAKWQMQFDYIIDQLHIDPIIVAKAKAAAVS